MENNIFHQTIKPHFDPRCWAVLNSAETQFIDGGLELARLKRKYPLHKIVSGSEANRLMGLTDHGELI